MKETAETSPDASLHTLSGSIIHANPREKQNPQTGKKKQKNMLITSIAQQLPSKSKLAALEPDASNVMQGILVGFKVVRAERHI